MKIPNKIKIVPSVRNVDNRFRFDDWEGTDPKKIAEYMAYKINEIIDYLYELPQIPNELPTKIKAEGDQIVHEHRWILESRFGSRGYFRCIDCGEREQKLIQGA